MGRVSRGGPELPVPFTRRFRLRIDPTDRAVAGFVDPALASGSRDVRIDGNQAAATARHAALVGAGAPVVELFDTGAGPGLRLYRVRVGTDVVEVCPATGLVARYEGGRC